MEVDQLCSPSSSPASASVSPLCRRLKQYKVSTPPWKDSFRQKCFERLRTNRQRLVDRYRHTGQQPDAADVRSIVAEEVDCLKRTNSLADAELEQYLHVYEEIQRELEAREREWQAELAEEYLAAAEQVVDVDDVDRVVCPQCLTANLCVQPSAVYCSGRNCNFGCHKLQSAHRWSATELACLIACTFAEHTQSGCPGRLCWSITDRCQLLAACQHCAYFNCAEQP